MLNNFPPNDLPNMSTPTDGHRIGVKFQPNNLLSWPTPGNNIDHESLFKKIDIINNRKIVVDLI